MLPCNRIPSVVASALKTQYHHDPQLLEDALRIYLQTKDVAKGKLLHARLIKSAYPLQTDIRLTNKLISLYAKCGSIHDGLSLLQQIQILDAVSWTTLISAFAKSRIPEKSLQLFIDMQKTCVRPDAHTYATVLGASYNLKFLQSLHVGVMKLGFHSEIFVGSALVRNYTKFSSIEDARQVFDEMFAKNEVSWNSLIAGYCDSGRMREAFDVFNNSPVKNTVAWNTMIHGFCSTGNMEKALEFFEQMPEQNVVSWSCLLRGYLQKGDVDEAMRVFEKMPERNIVSWTTLVVGLTQNKRSHQALMVYKNMLTSKVIPNVATFVGVIPACSDLGALEEGIEIHKEIVRRGYECEIQVGNSLISMYSKCGDVGQARNQFDRMKIRDVASWNAMIFGYAMHGLGKKAIQLFEAMKMVGPRPNHITFVGLLYACSHAGLLEDGLKYFEIMRGEFGVSPSELHYGCIADMLGRAGHIQEAKKICSMSPFLRNESMLVSLLSACRVHGNKQVGDWVASKLVELNPHSFSPYVLLSNVYANDKDWDCVGRLRDEMKERSVVKSPACSWIEVNKEIHVFVGC